MDFESTLNDPAAPLAIDFEPNRNVLLLTFGGLAGKLGLPMFEFNKITSGLKNVNRLFLRDRYRLWYHRGLPNVGNNIESIVGFLHRYTTHAATQRTVVIGNSGGGYAALLFGHLLQVDEVHAFALKLLLIPFNALYIMTSRPGTRSRLGGGCFFCGQREYFDFKKVFLISQNIRTNFCIHYPANNKNDCLHATRMSTLSNVHLHSYQYGKHGLIRHLKQTGELSQIIERAIQFDGDR